MFRGAVRSYADVVRNPSGGAALPPDAAAGAIVSWCQRTILQEEVSSISVEEADVERVLAVWMREGIVQPYDPERIRASSLYRDAYQMVVDEAAQANALRIEAIHAEVSGAIALEYQVPLDVFRAMAAALPPGTSVCCEGELSEAAYLEGIRHDIRTYLRRDAATMRIVEAGAVGGEEDLVTALASHLEQPDLDARRTVRSEDPIRFLLLERLWTLFQIQEIRAGLIVHDPAVAALVSQRLDRSEHQAITFFQSSEVPAFALLRGVVAE